MIGITFWSLAEGVEPRWRAVHQAKGRIQVAICHNMDLGDAWEWADAPRYPERHASLAYRIGLNYLVYSMTHQPVPPTGRAPLLMNHCVHRRFDLDSGADDGVPGEAWTRHLIMSSCSY